MDTTIDLFLVAERVVVCEAKTVLQATQLLLAEFYVFNIAYLHEVPWRTLLLLRGLFVWD